MINESNIYQRSENCFLEEMDDEILLYNPSNNITLHLNESSALVWKMLDGQHSIGTLIAVLQEQYPDAKDQIQIDVTELIEQLVKEEAVEEVSVAS